MNVLLAALIVCTLLHSLSMYVFYPTAEHSIKMRMRFRKAGFPYREKWINPSTKRFATSLVGTITGCIGITAILLTRVF